MATRKTPQTKKAPVKKQVAKKTAKSNFMSLKLTQQTAYWSVLGLVVLIFGMWVTQLSIDVQRIYDDIESVDTTVYRTEVKQH